jgi:hypothetical protein
MMKLGTFVDVLGVVSHASFHLHMMHNLRAIAGVKKEVLSYGYGSYNNAASAQTSEDVRTSPRNPRNSWVEKRGKNF